MSGRALAATERVVCLAAPDSAGAVDRLVDAVQRHDATLVLRDVGDTVRDEDIVPGATLGVTIGGDGTFLTGTQAFAPRSVPFLGINAGTLGFLARIRPDDLPAALDAVFAGNVTVSPRQRFRVSGPDIEVSGINEVTLELPIPADPVGRKVCRLEVGVDGEYLGEYEGTGLAVTAPTGSTAMALSAGGPVHEHAGNDTLQVVGLHTNRLGHQPIVCDADREIRVRTTAPVQLTVDGGRPRTQVDAGTTLTVTGDTAPADVVETPEDRQFFDALGDRLGWNHDTPEQTTDRRVLQSADETGVSETAASAVRSAGQAVRTAGDAFLRTDHWADRAAFLADVRRRSERVLAATLDTDTRRSRVDGTAVWPASKSDTWAATLLDGGDNLARGTPQYAVGLTRWEDEEPTVSAVCLPGFRELLLAGRDTRTVRIDTPADPEQTRDERTTRVGPTSQTDLGGCQFLSAGAPGLASLEGVGNAQVQRVGCDTLAVTRVTTGLADACLLPNVSPGIVPALCLLRGAGGRATTLTGEGLSLRPGEVTQQDIVVSNGPVHEAFRRRVEESL